MATLMKKGNGERLVPDEKVAEFLEMGYSAIDDLGQVLIQAKPTTIADYKSLVSKLQQENAALQADCQQLKQMCEQLSAANAPDSSYKPPVNQETNNPAPNEETPQNAKRAAKTASRK